MKNEKQQKQKHKSWPNSEHTKQYIYFLKKLLLRVKKEKRKRYRGFQIANIVKLFSSGLYSINGSKTAKFSYCPKWKVWLIKRIQLHDSLKELS